MTFELIACRFSFVALDSIFFPHLKAGNILRGAFGTIFRRIACLPGCNAASTCEHRSVCAYARVFEPTAAGSGPSGFADPPRPFVFRAAHLDGRMVRPGEPFHFDLHLFDVVNPDLAYFVHTFAQLVNDGLGPRRGRAELRSVTYLDETHTPRHTVRYEAGTFRLADDPLRVSIPLEPYAARVSRMLVQFVTPTELKGEARGDGEADFSVLFARSRDRVSTLRGRYGAGPLSIDFQAMGDLARQVRLIRSALTRVDVDRRSSRTGQTHPLGGFVGEAEYVGKLSPLAPFLRAAEWTGVGRQTVWGKGEIRCRIVPSD